jgi:protein-L-isoaspartate O-methyltransferase
MTITLQDLDFLTSDAGAAVLARLAGESLADDQTLKLLTALRRELTPQQAGAALELARLRQKAVAKFGADAAKMFFTREALEQASDPLVRRWRVLNMLAGLWVVDACCSIGADALAFAQAGAEVLGLDIDPVRVAMARLNAAALGIANVRFEVADVRESVPEADLIFFDPARRTDDGKRIFDVERYEPPLATIRGWQAQRIVVKLSPGVDLAQLQPYGGLIDFISVEGDLKEATLTLLDGKPGEGIRYGAALLSHHTPTSLPFLGYWTYDPSFPEEAPISEPRRWLVEPDPAIIRSGQVAGLANKLGGAMLDPEIAYLTTDEQPVSHWVRAWEIIDWMPFNLKKLRVYLREQNVGTVTVKKRGTAVTPEELIGKLKLNGSESRTVVLTRCRAEQVVLVCRDFVTTQGG